jgi:2-amino-4-hydroxy-6-hydroxymethyldihydropteridine diphosphokinase
VVTPRHAKSEPRAQARGQSKPEAPATAQAVASAPRGGRPPTTTQKRITVYIALGSNLGDRDQTIRAALRDLEEENDIRVLRCSTLHETKPVGGPLAQPRYLNAVAAIKTSLAPRALLRRLQEIEHRHGRRRRVKNGPRTLDLDLLLYGDRVINEQDLVVPHPRMWERPFVMQPLEEICDPRILAARRETAFAPRGGRSESTEQAPRRGAFETEAGAP